ncbi:MAG: GNAT family N-acetyltransferase [Proteobacteria bacterium]|nr:GNAT family N-acetyltransferase [Pseudomonadota bacterium]
MTPQPPAGVRIVRVTDRFPEPAFSDLQRQVFAALQQPSEAWAQTLATESQPEPAPALANQPPMVRFGAYERPQTCRCASGPPRGSSKLGSGPSLAWEGDTLVGWSCGWFERGRTYYMANSGVRPSHQRQGIYSALLNQVLAFARDSGAVLVRSQHSVLNNTVLIAKLAHGFHISGLSQSAQMGLLVELTCHLSAPRERLYAQRCLPYAEREVGKPPPLP